MTSWASSGALAEGWAAPRPATGSALAMEVRSLGPACVVRLAGELDVATGPLVVLVGGDLVAKGARTIILDLAEVRFCDVRGLAALRNVAGSLRARGGRIALRSPPAQVTSLLRLLGLAATLPIELRAAERSADVVPGAGRGRSAGRDGAVTGG